jgi:hypothetical protein
MTFTDKLIASGYEQDVDDRFDKDCYIRWSYAEGVIQVYQKCENEGEWNFMEMTENCDVLSKITFNPDGNRIMLTDTAQDQQIRRTIQKKIENEMPLQLLKRIVYEVRCEELGIRPDSWKLYPED